MLFHPEVASRSCEDCGKWMYDEKTGRRQERGGQPLPRPPGTPTPCWNCPKKSPRESRTIELSSKNVIAYDYYMTARAPLGQQLPADQITLRNHALIDQVMRQAEQLAAYRGIAHGVSSALLMGGGR